jgi:hypothetical protein
VVAHALCLLWLCSAAQLLLDGGVGAVHHGGPACM